MGLVAPVFCVGLRSPMTTDDPRCPYCVEGNGFRLLKLVGDVFYCKHCGHQSLPSDSIFICYCPHVSGCVWATADSKAGG